MKPRWIFFDLGSTLIDETDADLLRIQEMTAGTEVSEEAYREKRLEFIRQGVSGDQAAIAWFGLTKTPWHSEEERPYPDAAPTLAELKRRGFRLGVIANQNPGTERRLADWKLLQYFDFVVASAEAGLEKPDPAIFRLALEKADCPPELCVMVGDRMDNDIAPAKALGLHTVRLLRGLGAYHSPRSPAEEPEHTLRELAELPDLFDDRNGETKMNESIVKKTETFLTERFDSSPYFSVNPEAKEYRLEHSYRVANVGRQIARKEGFDETEMVVACLLHDVSYCEVFGEDGWREHGRRSAHISRPFLRTLGLPEDRIGDICYGIAIHVDDQADFPGERTPFALSVGDADNIDRLDVYRIHETLSCDKFLEMSYPDKLEYTKKRLTRLRELLELPMGTKAAEELWKERVSFYISFYEKLLAQLNSSKAVL